ncbi:MAG: hypothetical protein JRG92_12685 [Deltaproteobacteria bacterium]|nr:hypothetical protein [Deltaproteobacteria bacterium]MBW2384487.1 hypothetical protein [Deltaproteobacteria bacterium]
MTKSPLRPGKLPAALLRSLLEAAVGTDADVLLPPAVGEDACVIRVAGGALVAATDPITLTGEGVGAHAVVINANDVAVMGARPRWFLAVVLLPPGSNEALVRDLFRSMRKALDRVGATLVGGHSEVTPAVSQPVVVGQMLGLREDGQFVATGSMRVGDSIVQVGRAPVEGAAVVATEIAEALTALPNDVIEAARRALDEPGISVVEPALLCAELGATALHDPTEGGLSAGLHELAEASGLRIAGLREDTVLWFEPGRAICECIGADPWGMLASGALLAAFPSDRAEMAIRALRQAGNPAQVIARAEPGKGVWLANGEALVRYDRDELSRIL